MIKVTGLCKSYGPTRALNGVDFEIKANEVVGLLGPNGAGKTTVMKILTGYLHASSGTANIGGLDVAADPLRVQAEVGYLPENAPVYTDMAVQEYLQMIAELRQIPKADQLGLIGDAIHNTGLVEHMVRPIGELSKGLRQRVGLAQAILHKPKVLILDEPTSGLDPTQIAEIRRLIAHLAQEATVLLSTHILSEVELSCERVLIINRGEVTTDAQISDLKAGNTAVIAIDQDGEEARKEILALDGVNDVTFLTTGGSKAPAGFHNYRITSESDDLCPALFDLAKSRGWRMAELRQDQNTLESVFNRAVRARGAA